MLSLEKIFKAFFSDATGIKITSLGEGNINDTYKVAFNGEYYLLQRINHEVFKQPEVVVANYDQATKHLQGKLPQLHIPQLFPTQLGSLFYFDDGGNTWRLLEFVSDSIGFEQVNQQSEIEEAAQQFGQFLNALNTNIAIDIKDTIPDFHNFKKRFIDFQNIVEADTYQRLQLVAKEVNYLIEQAATIPDYDELNIPIRLVHNDPKIGNFLFNKQGKVIAVIDWDTMMRGRIATDFGDMVRTMAATASEDEADLEKVALNIDYYEAICANLLPNLKQLLDPVEKQYLHTGAAYIVLEQMLRFLGDYLNGDQYYKIDYPEHNLVRARNQMKLFQDLKLKEQMLQQLVQNYLEN